MTTSVLSESFSIAELRSLVDSTDRITTHISVPALLVTVAHPADFDDNGIEVLNDLISTKITGSPVGLTDIGWEVQALIGLDTVILEVSAIVEFGFLDESSDADILRELGMDDEADDLDEMGGNF